MPNHPKPPSKPRKSTRKMDPTEGLPPLNLNAAGIDVGSAEHHVAVPGDRDAEPVQSCGSFTADLHRMARWLKDCRIQTVVMQSTGVYWTALYDVLESYGLEVNVANARHTKTLPGRKTDVQECQWLQKLHTFGLLNNSFRTISTATITSVRTRRTAIRRRQTCSRTNPKGRGHCHDGGSAPNPPGVSAFVFQKGCFSLYSKQHLPYNRNAC